MQIPDSVDGGTITDVLQECMSALQDPTPTTVSNVLLTLLRADAPAIVMEVFTSMGDPLSPVDAVCAYAASWMMGRRPDAVPPHMQDQATGYGTQSTAILQLARTLSSPEATLPDVAVFLQDWKAMERGALRVALHILQARNLLPSIPDITARELALHLMRLDVRRRGLYNTWTELHRTSAMAGRPEHVTMVTLVDRILASVNEKDVAGHLAKVRAITLRYQQECAIGYPASRTLDELKAALLVLRSSIVDGKD